MDSTIAYGILSNFTCYRLSDIKKSFSDDFRSERIVKFDHIGEFNMNNGAKLLIESVNFYETRLCLKKGDLVPHWSKTDN